MQLPLPVSFHLAALCLALPLVGVLMLPTTTSISRRRPLPAASSGSLFWASLFPVCCLKRSACCWSLCLPSQNSLVGVWLLPPLPHLVSWAQLLWSFSLSALSPTIFPMITA